MSTKVRELIKKIRACKTAEEERSVINKESAEMRNMSKEATNQEKARNILKCIYVHMMGYTTTFMHVTTVNLLASLNFSEKRIAYSALCLLLDEKSEVLLLSTQTIKKDLENPNFSIIAMALNAIGEVCTTHMCRELASEVGKLMYNPNSYLKKKAALAFSKIIRKCPELVEGYIKNVQSYFEEKHHGVLICGLTLVCQIYKIKPELIKKFTKYLPVLVKYLKNLIAVSYSPEYDVNGITDPFLQTKILEVLHYIGKGNKQLSEEMRDILSSVSSSTEGSKNTGIAILYELVRTINGIEADTGLRSLASTIIGKLLTNRDNNYKYIALNTLREVVLTDLQIVQKHRNTILDCLKDNDISIKRRALDLVYLIINTSNIKQIVKECLNFLLSAENEIKLELTTKITQSLNKYSPSVKWQIDTFIKMLCISGTNISEDSISSIINTIIEAEELRLYSVHKLFLAMKNNKESESLIKVGIYIIGEFGDLLVKNNVIGPEDETISVNETEVIQVLKQIEKTEYSSPSILEYLMNCYLKLSNKYSTNVGEMIRMSIEEESKSFHAEVQQRAVEYVTFSKILKEDLKREVIKPIPTEKSDQIDVTKREISLEDDDMDLEESEKKILIKYCNKAPLKISNDNINTENKIQNSNLNLLEIFGNTNLNTVEIQNLGNINNNFINNDIMSNLLSAYPGSKSESSNGLINMTAIPNMKEVFSNNDLSIKLSFSKLSQDTYEGAYYVSNNSPVQLSDVTLKFMVLKFVNLKVISTSSTYLEPFQVNGIKKEFSMTSSDLTKKIVMKINYSYKKNETTITNTITIEDFN